MPPTVMRPLATPVLLVERFPAAWVPCVPPDVIVCPWVPWVPCVPAVAPETDVDAWLAVAAGWFTAVCTVAFLLSSCTTAPPSTRVATALSVMKTIATFSRIRSAPVPGHGPSMHVQFEYVVQVPFSLRIQSKQWFGSWLDPAEYVIGTVSPVSKFLMVLSASTNDLRVTGFFPIRLIASTKTFAATQSPSLK